MADFPSYAPTQFRALGLSHVARGYWRYVALDSRPDWPAVVGPQFRTKAEALAALPEYGQRNYPND